jgi:hypothetical protein
MTCLDVDMHDLAVGCCEQLKEREASRAYVLSATDVRGHGVGSTVQDGVVFKLGGLWERRSLASWGR